MTAIEFSLLPGYRGMGWFVGRESGRNENLFL